MTGRIMSGSNITLSGCGVIRSSNFSGINIFQNTNKKQTLEEGSFSYYK